MAIFIITVSIYAIMCVAPAIQCTQIPPQALEIMIAGGSFELAFEIAAGVIKIYKEKNNDE